MKKFDVSFKVEDKIISNLSEGIGWNYYPHLVNPTGDDFELYMDLFEWTKPDYIRFSTSMRGWNPQKDDYTQLNDERLASILKFTDQFEKRKIPYFLANWTNGIPWLSELDTYASGPNDAEMFADIYVNVLAYLVKNKGYQYLQGFSLWNEPEWNGPSYVSEKYPYPNGFLSMYPIFDAKLKEYGIRDQIKIIGMDGSGFLNKRHLKELVTAEQFAKYTQKVPDIISIHNYEYFSDYNPLKRFGKTITEGVADVSKLKADLNAAYGKEVPLVIGEYGNFGYGAGDVKYRNLNMTDQYIGSLSIAELVIRFTNAGVNGFLEWAYTSKQIDDYETNPIISDDEYLFTINPPVYYMNAILSRYVKAKSNVYNMVLLDDADCTDGIHNVYATCLQLPDDNFTLQIVNSSPEDKLICFDISQIEKLQEKALTHLYIVGPYAEDGFHKGKPVNSENGLLTLKVCGQSINAVTSCDPGDLTFPAKCKVKRLK